MDASAKYQVNDNSFPRPIQRKPTNVSSFLLPRARVAPLRTLPVLQPNSHKNFSLAIRDRGLSCVTSLPTRCHISMPISHPASIRPRSHVPRSKRSRRRLRCCCRRAFRGRYHHPCHGLHQFQYLLDIEVLDRSHHPLRQDILLWRGWREGPGNRQESLRHSRFRRGLFGWRCSSIRPRDALSARRRSGFSA